MIDQNLEIQIEDYSGPLDLLIHLIYKNEMNIFNISLFEITNKFIDELKAMKELDIEIAGEFIEMATYLIYLKSKMLLPKEEQTGDEEESIEEQTFKLNQKLIELSFCKDTAEVLRDAAINNRRFLRRSESLLLLNEEDQTEDIYNLSNIFFNMQTKEKKEKTLVVKNSKIATETLALKVKEFILSREKTLWTDIYKTCKEPIEACVSFGSVLELIKAKRIKAFQEKNFDDILLTKRYDDEYLKISQNNNIQK